jgi:hypothetical protein
MVLVDTIGGAVSDACHQALTAYHCRLLFAPCGYRDVVGLLNITDTNTATQLIGNELYPPSDLCTGVTNAVRW